ncbi:MAG: hypothetical protein ABF449_02395 [Ethanoligenens sp.]
MLINGAWNISAYPNEIIVELSDGTLKHFFINPFRKITDKDLHQYNGYHPRKAKGQPLPDYMYPLYGLERNAESLSEVIRLRVSPSEKAAFESYTNSLEPRQSVSDALREFIRSKI